MSNGFGLSGGASPLEEFSMGSPPKQMRINQNGLFQVIHLSIFQSVFLPSCLSIFLESCLSKNSQQKFKIMLATIYLYFNQSKCQSTVYFYIQRMLLAIYTNINISTNIYLCIFRMLLAIYPQSSQLPAYLSMYI